MHRIVSLLTCSLLVAVAAVAAPAPVHKPDRTEWLGMDGWDKPINPRGDCKFQRAGSKILLSVPFNESYFSLVQSHMTPPGLLRDVEGDFTIEVQVSGKFGPTDGRIRLAGLMLVSEACNWEFSRHGLKIAGSEECQCWALNQYDAKDRGGDWFSDDTPRSNTSHLRVQRRGQKLQAAFSENGVKWVPMKTEGRVDIALPPKLKIGVFATTTEDDGFKLIFDKFKLTQP